MPRGSQNPIDKYVGSRVRMRRLMLEMSQTNLADALGLTFQQVQKYEKGTNRIGASRLQHISQILQVPVPFFFEGAPSASGLPPDREAAEAPSPSYVTDFFATSDGLFLMKRSCASQTRNCAAASSGLFRRSRRRRREPETGSRA
jgi:transcriptional regulator with XRE-family HTH domain